MGMISSKESPPALEATPDRPESIISSKMHGRQASVRQSTIRAKSKQPMPDPNELERRFTKVLVSLFSSGSSGVQLFFIHAKTGSVVVVSR